MASGDGALCRVVARGRNGGSDRGVCEGRRRGNIQRQRVPGERPYLQYFAMRTGACPMADIDMCCIASCRHMPCRGGSCRRCGMDWAAVHAWVLYCMRAGRRDSVGELCDWAEWCADAWKSGHVMYFGVPDG